MHDPRDDIVIGVDAKADEFSRTNVVGMCCELISKRGNAVDGTHDEHAANGVSLKLGLRTPGTVRLTRRAMVLNTLRRRRVSRVACRVSRVACRVSRVACCVSRACCVSQSRVVSYGAVGVLRGVRV